MRTTLIFERGIGTTIMREIEAACRSVQTNAASKAVIGTDTYVHYSPDGVSCEFNRRLAVLPSEMRVKPPHTVQLQYIERNLDLPTGIFALGSALIVSESSIHTPRTGDSYVTHAIVAEGPTLDAVNALMDDFLKHGAVSIPSITWITIGRMLADAVARLKVFVAGFSRQTC